VVNSPLSVRPLRSLGPSRAQCPTPMQVGQAPISLLKVGAFYIRGQDARSGGALSGPTGSCWQAALHDVVGAERPSSPGIPAYRPSRGQPRAALHSARVHWSSRFPLIVQAVTRLKAHSVIIDGEAVVCVVLDLVHPCGASWRSLRWGGKASEPGRDVGRAGASGWPPVSDLG
jgi:hypothetical protein